MRWVPTLTESYSDLRLEAAGERAEVLFHRAWAWAGHQETDGFIPTAMVARLCPTGWKARAAALVTSQLWEAVDGGWRMVPWESVLAEVDGLRRRRDNDAERKRRQRDREAATRPGHETPSREDRRDTSRDVSRDSPRLEGEGENYPPNPPHSGGNDEQLNSDWTPGQCGLHRDRPGTRCRRCGTTDRQLATAAAERELRTAAAQLADLVERRHALEWCGGEDCDPRIRKLKVPGGLVKCPSCHPDVVVGPLPVERPALTVVGGGRGVPF